ncbi:MAG: hypothetical protein M1817_000188 [Caeruleum heppii]|nr:MAG: hypothetical protein M1817_000188 [Caeruleum heppii]
MLSGLFFAFWRWMEIVTLIPIVGMLAYFVNGFVKSNVLTPNFILVLFVTSVLAAAWAVYTLLAYSRTKHSAVFVSFVDLCFVAALIAGVVELRGIANADCVSFGRDANDNNSVYVNLGPFGSWGSSWNSSLSINSNKNCAMLKACFALGIMNCIFFFFTSILALFLHRRNKDYVRKSETHSRRHSHRRRSGSRSSPRRAY